jgi:hypothetical protein
LRREVNEEIALAFAKVEHPQGSSFAAAPQCRIGIEGFSAGVLGRKARFHMFPGA